MTAIVILSAAKDLSYFAHRKGYRSFGVPQDDKRRLSAPVIGASSFVIDWSFGFTHWSFLRSGPHAFGAPGFFSCTQS